MAPPNLQGLNVIHSPPPAADAHDLLGQSFPDLAAQLDLWSNLTFDSDEGPIINKLDDEGKSADDDEDARSPSLGTTEAAIRDGHVNVVAGTNLSTNKPALDPPRHVHQSPQFDLQAILAGFGIDPFTTTQQSVSTAATAVAPSLAQLLAFQSANFAHPPQNPAAPPVIASVQQQQQQSPSAGEKSYASSSDDGYPPQKRTRSRRASEITAAASANNPAAPEKIAVLAAEDKRRRNTAASARFRLKKKEREAALEGKAKELESRVNELERECETLRRENGWLKGLVIGVTGVAQAPVINATQLPTTAVKRTRDEAERS